MVFPNCLNNYFSNNLLKKASWGNTDNAIRFYGKNYIGPMGLALFPSPSLLSKINEKIHGMTPAPAHGWTSRHREKVNIGIILSEQGMIICEDTVNFSIVQTIISLSLLVNLILNKQRMMIICKKSRCEWPLHSW